MLIVRESEPALLVQWAFVAFMMGHSLEGLLQWRAILLLLLGSFALPQKLPQGPQLYCPALKVGPTHVCCATHLPSGKTRDLVGLRTG